MTNANASDRDPIDVGQPEESELAEEELGTGGPAPTEKPEEERAEEVLEPLEGGAETMADLEEDEERPHEGTEPPQQKP